MANIPVERTSGTPWWLWLVGLLLLGGLIWFLAEAFGDDDEIAEDPVEVVDDPVAVSALDLSDVYVTRVVGDNTFFVAPTEGGADETLVYLEEEATPGQPVEGRYDVTVGQNLAIDGSMEPTPADLTPWGLTDAQIAMVGDQYVRATSLTVLDGAMTDGATGDITALSGLAGDLSAMAGRTVSLDGVRVEALAGDSTFYIGTGDQRTLVILESLGESEAGIAGTDGAFDINVGDMLDLDAEIMAFRRGMRGTTSMTESDQAAADARRFVIVVNSRGDLSKL